MGGNSLFLVGFIWLLLVGIQENGGVTAMLSSQLTGNYKHVEIIGRRKLAHRQELDPNYMSKRRVPNGPDPIHNRRARNTRRPPGRS